MSFLFLSKDESRNMVDICFILPNDCQNIVIFLFFFLRTRLPSAWGSIISHIQNETEFFVNNN